MKAGRRPRTSPKIRMRGARGGPTRLMVAAPVGWSNGSKTLTQTERASTRLTGGPLFLKFRKLHVARALTGGSCFVGFGKCEMLRGSWRFERGDRLEI